MKIILLLLSFIIIISKKKFRLSHRELYSTNNNKKQSNLVQQSQSQPSNQQSISSNQLTDNPQQPQSNNQSLLDRKLRAMEIDGIESRSSNLSRKFKNKKFIGQGLLAKAAEIGGKLVDKFAATGAGKWLSRLKMPQSVLNKASKLGNSYLFQKGAKYGNVFMAKYGNDLLARGKDIADMGIKFYAKNGMLVDRAAFGFYNRAMKPSEDINSKKDNIILVPVITPVLQGSSGMKEYPEAIQGQTQYPLIPPMSDAETIQQKAKEEEEAEKKQQEEGGESSKKRLKKKSKFKK